MASPLRPTACLLALALAAGASGQGASGQGASGQQPGAKPELSRSDLRLSIPPADEVFFRFLPAGPRLAFDRPLLLSAAAGEERAYSIEIETEAGISRRDFLIDKRPPAPPRAFAAGGLYAESLELRLEAEEGASITYSLLGPGVERGGFQPYDRLRPPRLEAPAQGVESWALLAFAEDGAGNRSEPARFVYRLASPGLQAEAPPPSTSPPELRPDPLVELFDPESQPLDSGLVLLFKKPWAGRLFAAVGPGAAVGKPEAYAPLPESEGQARLALRAPYGWSAELPIYLALEQEGRLSYRPEPLRIRLSALPAVSPAPPTPSPPAILAGPPGRGAFLVFPNYEGAIAYSLDGAPEASYLDPIPLEPGAGRLKLVWRGLSPEGLASAPGSLELPRPALVEAPQILGIEGPALGSSVRRLGSLPGTSIRYEISAGGSPPPEPTASSPLLGPELLLDCPPGESRRYGFRYRPFTGRGPEALGGDSALLVFEIDRSPPPPPRLKSAPAAYSLNAQELELEAPEGRIFASLSTEGRSEPFREIDSPLSLPGSRDGSIVYILRAYALDAAGNASAELGPLRFTVDASSLYVDSLARGEGGGGPEQPFSDLPRALEAAKETGRRVLRLRGTFLLPAAFRLEGEDLVFEGGFDAEWKANPGLPAILQLSGATEAAAALSLSETELLLKRVELRASPADGSLLAVKGGGLVLEESSISADSVGELILVTLEGAGLVLENSRLLLGGRGGGALISARDSALEIRGSELGSGAELDHFAGIDAAGSSILIEESLLSGRASLGLVLLSASGSTLDLNRSSLSIAGGPGFLRAGRLTSTRGEIRNSRIELAVAGSALLFDLEDSPLAFVHDSLFAQAEGGRLRFFESRGEPPSFLNSLFYAPGGAELFLASERGIRAGDIASSAFAGFAAYLSGAQRAGSLAALEALNGKSGFPPNIELGRSGSLALTPKDGLMPDASSALIDAAAPLSGSNYALDFRGFPRPSRLGKGLPDIGADELGN